MSKKETGFSGEERVYPELMHSNSAEISASETSTGDIARYIRDALPQIVASALIVGILGVAGVFFSRLALPGVTSYRTSLVITMAGAEPGKYPNGTTFAPTDLRSPAVLDEVFQANKLSNYGMDLVTFLGMVSVETYSPSFSSMTERFRARLSDKALTFEEKKSIEAEFQQSIDNLSAKGVLLTLTLHESDKIPDVLAQKIVDDIPAKWAGLFVDRLGVANLPVPVSGSKLIDENFLRELDFPMAYDYLSDLSGKLQSKLSAIQALPGAISLISEKSGKGIDDLLREAEAIDQYRLKLSLKPLVDQGLSRDPLVTASIYTNRLDSIQKDASRQAELSDKVSRVLNDFRSKKSSSAAGEASSGGISTVTSGPQFDGAFIDKIIELSKQGGGVEFEQGLLQKKLEYENQNVSLSDQARRLAQRRDAIASNPLTLEARKDLEGRFIAGVELATKELNSLWADSYEFLSEINTERLNNDKALYRLNELPAEIRVEKQDFVTRRSLLVILALSFFGALAGLTSFAWRRALQSR